MSKENDERLKLAQEVKELSAYVTPLKRERNKLEAGPEKDPLAQKIKIRQHQALFYIDKIENVKINP